MLILPFKNVLIFVIVMIITMIMIMIIIITSETGNNNI